MTARSQYAFSCIVAIGSFLGGFISQAWAGEPLTLWDVLHATQTQHPALIQAEQDIVGAQGDVLLGRGFFDPTLKGKAELVPYGDFHTGKGEIFVEQKTDLWGLSATGGYRLGRGDFPIYKKEFLTSEGGQVLLKLKLPVLRGGAIDKSRAKWRAASQKEEGARQDAAMVALELLRKAAHHYWDWVAAGRRLVIATELLEIAKVRMVQISGRVERGDLPAIEAVDNQRAILKREGATIRARRAFERAALKLSLFYRNGYGDPRVPKASQLPASITWMPFNFESIDLIHDVDSALSHRPELKALGIKRAVIEIDQKLAKNNRLPALDISATGGIDMGDEPFESRRFEVLLGVSFRFPLLARAARGAVQRTQAEIFALQAKARFMADKIAMQVRDAHSALRAANESLLIAKRELKVAHQVEAAERERFRLGSSTLLAVNLRELAAAEAEVRAVNAAASLRRAMADYDAVMGRRLKS